MNNLQFKFHILIITSFFNVLIVQGTIAQEVGTFFTTPEERAYLDFLRQEFLLNNQANDFNIDEVVPVIPVIEEEVEAPVISNYTLRGIFTRQDGTRSVWLNGNNIDENNLPGNMRLLSSGGSTLLAIQLESGRFELRAGQTLDAVNGQVLESWQLPAIEQNAEIPENSAGIIEDERQSDTQLVKPDTTNLAALDAEQVDPLPTLEVETLSISAEEIRSIINSEDPVALTEFMQTLQNFEEVQIDDNAQ